MAISYCQDIYNLLCKKYPNRKIFIIGDQHFFHQNIIKYERCNFKSIEEMNAFIIKCHNGTVGKEDIVIFLGDLCFKSAFYRTILSQLNGHKYLVLGNHDNQYLVRNYHNMGLEGVFQSPIKLGDKIYLSHEPLVNDERPDLQFQLIVNEFKKCAGGINFHGHIHNPSYTISDGDYRNATCEALNYIPLEIGKTRSIEESDKPLFINSPYLDKILQLETEKHSINPTILLTDYIYSHILENAKEFFASYFVQGSFGLTHKYNFISNYSDIDFSVLYNGNESNHQNYDKLKKFVDSLFESLKQIDGINLSFYKRFISLRIINALYSSPKSAFANCVVDANLIRLDCYRDSDFISLNGMSLIEKYMPSEYEQLQMQLKFPHFTSQFLCVEGDIANLILQILFQDCPAEKKSLALKKLNYICKKSLNHEINNFSDIFTRFFLRNIAFFHTMSRFKEIQKIQEKMPDIYSWAFVLPSIIKDEFTKTLYDPNSYFMDVYREIAQTPVEQTMEKSIELTRKLK